MTLPYLMNCEHSGDGWCLECVKKLGEENADLRMVVLEVSRITFVHRFEDGDLDSTPDSISVKRDDFEQFEKASKMTLDACKRWMI